MSVINQMLKDLEYRRSTSSDKHANILRNVIYSSDSQARFESAKLVLYSIIFTVLVLLIFFMLWDQFYRNQTIKPLLVNTQDSTVKAVSSRNKTAVELAAKSRKQEKITQVSVAAKAVLPSNTSTEKKKMPSHAASSVVVNSSRKSEVGTETATVHKRKREPTPQKKAELAYQQGYQFLLTHNMSHAEQSLRDALMFDPYHHLSRELLAGIYIKTGRLVEARSLLQYGLKFSPGYSVFAKLYARLLLEQDKLITAIAVLQRQPPSKITDPEYFSLLAALYQKTDQHQQAARIYSSLLKLRPHAGVWWLGLAISLEALGKNRQASQAYEKAKNSGNLATGLYQYSNQRLKALQDISFPQD